jgi:general stress protein 26
MVDTQRTKEDAKGQLFAQLDKVKAGMLGVEGSGQHPQPMTAYPDPDAGIVWFITSRDTDLAKAAGHPVLSGGAVGDKIANFALIGKKDDYWANMRGPLDQIDDEAKIDELWSAQAAAWFEKGREDHEVTLLRLTLQEAEIWSSSRNPVVFAFEMAKAMGSQTRPDLGEHVKITWPGTA